MSQQESDLLFVKIIWMGLILLVIIRKVCIVVFLTLNLTQFLRRNGLQLWELHARGIKKLLLDPKINQYRKKSD